MSSWVGASIGTCAIALAVGGLISQPKERVIAGFATSLAGRTRNQRHNALLAAKRLNGAQILPGQTFSFNDRVGSFNRDSGYRRAPVSFAGQLIPSWGGGVCQTSTTLYNAALVGGLEVVERHPHQFRPSYVPPGRDAAVSFGEVDLKLKNTYPFLLRVNADVVGDQLQVRFLGKGDGKSLDVRQVVRDIRPAGEIRLGNGDSPRIRNTGKSGYDVEVYRTEGTRVELVSHDIYPSMDRVVESN